MRVILRTRIICSTDNIASCSPTKIFWSDPWPEGVFALKIHVICPQFPSLHPLTSWEIRLWCCPPPPGPKRNMPTKNI